MSKRKSVLVEIPNYNTHAHKINARCYSHPQGKSEARCESWCSYRHGYCPRAPMQLSAEAGMPARAVVPTP